MKTLKKILSLLLALTMLCSIGVFASAEGAFVRSYKTPFQRYLLLGDSIPRGLSDDPRRSFDDDHFLNGGYPQLIANTYGIPERVDMARTGWRVQEARIALEDDYYGDEYTGDPRWMGPYADWGSYSLDMIVSERQLMRDELAKAELITVNYGSNNVAGTLLYSVQKALEYGTAGTECQQAALEAIEQAKQKYSELEAVVTMLDFIMTLENGAILLETIHTDFTAAMAEFPWQWNLLADDIFRYANPDATVVVLGIYNVTSSVLMKQLDGVPQPVADFLNMLTQPVIDYINNHMRYFCPRANDYVFVDIDGVSLEGSWDGTHISDAGHQEVAERIIRALSGVIPCAHDGETHLVNYAAPTKLTLGYSGDTVCDICGRTIAHGAITKWKCTHENQKLIGAIKPTVLTAGYSGNVVCMDCGRIMQVGHIELFHCSHESTKTVGTIPATRLHTGFTGNTVCTVCGKIMEIGRITPIKTR